MKKFAGFMAVALIALMVITGNALAAKSVQKTVSIPAEFRATIQTANCSALPGPRIDFQTELMPSALQADIIFSNPAGQGPIEEFVADQTLIPANSEVTPLPQSVVAAVSEDPFIWLQLTTAKGQALSSEIFLGQCSQGTFSPIVQLAVPVEVEADLSSSSCDSTTGPLVSINDGAAVLSAIHGRLIFRNTSDSHRGAGARGEVALDLVMVPAGQTYAFPQPLVQGEIGADPQISLQLREGGGQPISNEIRLGRCVALSN